MSILTQEMIGATSDVGCLQDIVDHLKNGLPPIAKLSYEQKVSFLDRAGVHVDFELEQPGGICVGTPLYTEGAGGFLMADITKESPTQPPPRMLYAPLQLLAGDRAISGTVENAIVTFVSPYGALKDRPLLVTKHQTEISVLLGLTNASFRSGEREVGLDGLYKIYIALFHKKFTFHQPLPSTD